MQKRILVVDDRLTFAHLVRRMVPDSDVRHTMSATTALVVAHFWQPDLFIVDQDLPDIRGAELAELIRHDEALGNIPILFVSSFVELPEVSSGRTVLDGNLAFGMPICMTTFRQHAARYLVGNDLHLVPKILERDQTPARPFQRNERGV